MVKRITESRPSAVRTGRARLSWEIWGKVKIHNGSKMAMDREVKEENCWAGQNTQTAAAPRDEE